MRRLALLAALAAAGCYSPSIPNGAQQCAPGGVCGDGYQCGADNRCYQVGQLPGDGGVRDLSAARDAAGGDLAGADLAGGDRVVAGDQAMARDLVMACAGDPDCGGATPRCDVTVHLCVPCLPQNDNCATGSFCTMVNGSWACQQGCKMDADCVGGGQPKCCANRCVDTLSDGANCGGCGTACGAQSCCAGACTDVTGDISNCGACGTVCSGKNANWTCTAKVCTVSSCSAPFANCNMQSGDGCEVNDGNDPSNCGSCGRTCSSNHVTASCGGGACNGACAGGFADCNGNKQTDGCETQVNGNDPSNCGGCGTVCSSNHVTPQCSGGACTGACAGGYADCNGNKQADGCEINLTNDPGHCGACANICSSNHVTPTCGNSVCNGVCQVGFADCNGSKLTDGCETNIFTDPANCGGCGILCGMAQSCVNGGCVGLTLVGQYVVNTGPLWSGNPPCYTCQEACALLFGGAVASYACSTQMGVIDHMASADGWGDTTHCVSTGGAPVPDTFKVNTAYNCGVMSCSFSAYVNDHGCTSTNYCFR